MIDSLVKPSERSLWQPIMVLSIDSLLYLSVLLLNKMKLTHTRAFVNHDLDQVLWRAFFSYIMVAGWRSIQMIRLFVLQ